MSPVDTGANRKSTVTMTAHRAGLVADYSAETHVVETGFGGQTALCGAGMITRPLRAPFDPRARGACAECARLVDSPDALAPRVELML